MPDPTPNSRRPIALRLAALGAAALALAYLVARNGSPLWQAIRVLAVALAAAGVAVAVLRLRPRLRGACLLAFGLPAAGAGVGFTATWASKAGLTLPTAAGFLALAAGLTLLGLGLADLGGRKGWKRWVIILAAALLLVVPLLALAIAVAATNVPPTARGEATPADYSLAFADVTFPTADGVTLAGWYVPSRNGAAVVVLHGAGSTVSSTLDQAAVLARAGYGVLLFDARGHGRSGGRAMDFGWFGDADVAAAVDYLAGRPDVDAARLAALGLSMGGEEAIGAAAADTRLRAVIAEGATGRIAADHAWLSDHYGFRGWIQEGVEHLTYGLTDMLTSARPPLALRDAVALMAPRPLLLIAAGGVPDEALAADYIRAASPGTVQVWEVPGAEHTSGLAIAPAEWEERVLAFLDTALAPEANG